MSSMKYLLGFVGFGEAAYHIAKGLASEGLREMCAYDVMQEDPVRGQAIRTRAHEIGVALTDCLQTLCGNAELILSLTSPAVCVDVARQVLPHLTRGQVFCDLNSADPVDMTAIDRLPRPEGVRFADVALLGSVPKEKHRTKMYLSGDGARAFYDAVLPWNTVLNLLDAPAGCASAIKMFKSVFSKGLPQLLLETYVPAAQYGVLDQIIDLTKNTFQTRSIEQFANENLYRTLIHAQRRATEAGACARTVERLGFDAAISHATEKKLQILAVQNYKERLGDAAPDLRQTVELVRADTKTNEGENQYV
jgi:3-hydroxyisobutyrate dehydrogenase-like beta-hydroxyacid dehydrogenase